MTIEKFKEDLANLATDDIVDRWMMTGSCAIVNDATAHAIGSAISAHFHIGYREIVYVGSAKLGFSIKPSRRYQPFGEDSDVDVAIVSRDLFERVWKEVYVYDHSGSYWPDKAKFRKYMYRGWIRPDLLPQSRVFDFSREWWPFFNRVGKSVCRYKIAAGIYHSEFFLREYQKICVSQCKTES